MKRQTERKPPYTPAREKIDYRESWKKPEPVVPWDFERAQILKDAVTITARARKAGWIK